MRWLAKPKSSPREGDRRIILPFAWVPLRAGRHWVWLERYWAAQEYVVTGSYDGVWCGWVTRERRLLS